MSEQSSPDGNPGGLRKGPTQAPVWYRKLSSRLLTETTVVAPSENGYLVRLYRNLPLVGSEDSDVTGAVLGLIKANLQTGGRTGWRIEVLRPATRWRAERVLYTQRVGAEPIVADVLRAITNALERGDKLWHAEDE